MIHMSNTFFMPTINIIGENAVSDAIEKIAEFGFKKSLIVTDKPLVNLGVVSKIVKQLKEVGIESIIFDGTQPNPTTANVKDGLKLFQNSNCDSVISIGGGSPHDAAKGIALVAENGGDIRDYAGVDVSAKPQAPLIAINTTAGTASEITRFCIITDEDRHVKMAIVDKHVTPLMSVNDPELMRLKPKALTANTGMDALTHAVEALVSLAATPVTDACSEKAIHLIFKYLPIAVNNGDDIDGREKMAYAQLLAGMAFNSASLGVVHATAHQLGGFYDLPHGICNALLLPASTEYNMRSEVAVSKLSSVAHLAGIDTSGMTETEMAKMFIIAIRELSAQVGITDTLGTLGVKVEDFDMLATNAMSDACIITNPVTMTHEGVKEIRAASM